MSVLNQTQGVVGIDLETTVNFGKNSDPFRDRIISIAVSNGDDHVLLEDDLARVFPLLRNPDVIKIIQNATFDLQFILQKFGILPENIWDSLIAERLIHAGDMRYSHGLADIIARRLGKYINKEVRTQFFQHSGIMTEEQRQYAIDDVRWLCALREQQLEDIGRLGLGKVIRLENKLVRVVTKAIVRGVGYDPDLWQEYLPKIQKYIGGLERQLAEFWGIPYMISPIDDSIHLVDKLGNPGKVQGWLAKVGVEVESTGEKILRKHTKKHPSVSLLLEWRRWSKLGSWGYGRFVNPVSGRIHPGWDQTGTSTGRFSSKEPNLQNVMRPDLDTPNLRHLFCPAAGYVYVVADYSQQEPRIYAQLCQDPNLLEACNTRDVYLAFAPTVYGEIIEKGDSRRHLLKTGVLATGYGARAKTLAGHMEVDLTIAKDFRRIILQAFPGMQSYYNRQIRSTLYSGKGRTILGRIRRFDIESYHNWQAKDSRKWAMQNEIINQPVQGTAADMLKIAMVTLDDRLQDYDAHQVIFIHDEIVVEVKEDQSQAVAEIVQTTMEEAGQKLCPDVKILAETKVVRKWSK